MIDLFIALIAIAVVIFVLIKKFKLYKKNGVAAFCGGDCTFCEKSCEIKKK